MTDNAVVSLPIQATAGASVGKAGTLRLWLSPSENCPVTSRKSFHVVCTSKGTKKGNTLSSLLQRVARG
jgi:hypothetical protein